MELQEAAVGPRHRWACLGARSVAFSQAVKVFRSLVLRIVVAVVSSSVLVSAGACRKVAPGTESTAEPPIVNDGTAGLMLTWIDEKGEFHNELHVTDVPAASRDLVRVRVLESNVDPSDGRVFVADLRTPGPGGAYPVRAIPRAEFEDTAVTRRTKNGGAVLSPHAAASAAASGATGPNAPGEVAGRPAVIIYGASWCGPCHQAAAHLKKRGVSFVEHDIEQDSAAGREMHAKLAKAGIRGGSIPVLDVRGKILVGFSAAAVDQALGTAL